MFVGPKSVDLIVCVVVILHGNFVRSEKQYCDIESCSPGQHTLCLYPNSGPGPNCQGYVAVPLTSEEKTNILGIHNDLRQIIAKGNQVGTVNERSPATNMRQLYWDDELAEVAQRWADQCSDDRDACRNLPGFSVGQNTLWLQRSDAADLMNRDVDQDVYAWWKEMKVFGEETRQSYEPRRRYEHFVQLIWANTSRLGCGRSFFEQDGEYRVNLVCNYGPAGNQIGEAVYLTGPIASACPNGPGTYEGLCK